MTVEEFIKYINNLRREHQGQWFFGCKTVEGKQVSFKSYGTWNQILNINGGRAGGLHGLNVTQWKAEIREAIKRS